MVKETFLVVIFCVSIANGANYDNSLDLRSYDGGSNDDDATIFPVAFIACEERQFDKKMCKSFSMELRHCANLRINHNVSTIDTMGYCYRGYEEMDCNGEAISFQIEEMAIPNAADSLVMRIDDKIKSVGRCNAVENLSGQLKHRSKRSKDNNYRRYLEEMAATALIAIVQQCINRLMPSRMPSFFSSSEPSSSSQYVDTSQIPGNTIQYNIFLIVSYYKLDYIVIVFIQ